MPLFLQQFPVVIEKNPDLGFTVGQSHTDPEDKVSHLYSSYIVLALWWSHQDTCKDVTELRLSPFSCK